MAKLTGGQAIVRTLTNHGVDTIFGLPGVQLDNTFDALYEARNTIRTIHTRHEQGAAYMALGYAQSSGKVGACIVGPGPGLLNAGAALATAAASNAPVLCIGGQLPSSQIGGGVGMTHEIRDQSAAMRGVAKWVGRAESAADAPSVLQDAFRQMLETRHQPVVFEMAPDVMGREEYVDLLDVQDYDGSAQPDVDALDKAAALLGQAGKPAIFVGSGVFGAEAELQRLSELLEAPVIMSRTGRGALGDSDYHAQGMIAGQDIWPSVDVALIVGTRFTTPALAWGRADEVKTVRIDIDGEQATKPRPSDITIISNARNGLAALCDLIEPQNRTRPSRETELRKVKADAQAKLETLEPQYGFAKVIRDEVPDDGIVVTDVTQMATYLQNWMPVHHPRTLITPSYQATLGYAFPTALGAQVAHPDRRVICISGDGGFMFNVQELSTAVAHHINVVTIVFADKAFGNVKRFQKDNYGERYIAVDLHNPDFAALAHTFGMTGIRAETPEELRAAIREAFAAPGPALIEVPVGEMPSVWDLIQRPSSAA
ncbi:MAG: thiamine pyrophosphate-binding protein [Alphaproteobacteria bacterium]|nr:thiamine pyrophosphate-binding protein [Alphaproteobacteria bacterium]